LKEHGNVFVEYYTQVLGSFQGRVLQLALF
jgi:hypothetical protein